MRADRRQAQVGRPQVPAERWIDAMYRLARHHNGEFIDGQHRIGRGVVSAVQAVDHKACWLAGQRCAVDAHADEAEQRAGACLGRHGGQHCVELLAEATGEVHILMAEQDPVAVAMRKRLRQRFGWAARTSTGNHLRPNFMQTGRAFDIGAQLRFASRWHDHRKKRLSSMARRVIETPHGLYDDARHTESAIGGSSWYAKRIGQRRRCFDKRGCGWQRRVLVRKRRHPARVEQPLISRRWGKRRVDRIDVGFDDLRQCRPTRSVIDRSNQGSAWRDLGVGHVEHRERRQPIA